MASISTGLGARGIDEIALALVASIGGVLIVWPLAAVEIPVWVLLMCGAIVYWTLWSWLRYLHRDARRGVLPWLEVWNTFYCFEYVLPVFGVTPPETDALTYLTLLSSISFFSFNAAFRLADEGWLAASSGAQAPSTARLVDRIGDNTLLQVGLGLLLVAWFGGLGGIFRQFRVLMVLLGELVMLLSYYRLLRGSYSDYRRAFVYGIVGMLMLLQIGSFYLGSVLMYAMMLALVHAYVRQSNPLKTLLLPALLMFLLNPVKGEVRKTFDWQEDSSSIEVLYCYGERATTYWTHTAWQDGATVWQVLWSSTLYRLDYLKELDIVVAHVPSRIDYYEGRYYRDYVLMLFIPRIIWPDKPSFHQSVLQYMHDCHGYDTVEDRGVHISPEFVGDLYLNFGLLGCLFGAALIGFCMGRLNGWLNRRQPDLFYKLVFFVLFRPTVLEMRSYLSNNLLFFLVFIFFGRVIASRLPTAAPVKPAAERLGA